MHLIPLNKKEISQSSALQFSKKTFISQDINKLRKNNLALNIAQNRITQSQLLYKQAYAGYLPQINAGYQASHRKFVNPFSFEPQDNITLHNLNGQISIIPDIFGRTRLRTQIADNQILADYFIEEMTYLDVINQYAQNYNLICATESLIQVNQNIVTLNQQLTDSTKLRFQLGRTNATNYYNALEALKSAQIAFEQSVQNHNLALQSYYTLIGQSFEQNEIKNNICHNGFVKLPTDKIDIALNVLDNRPDIQAARYHVIIADNNVDLSLKAFYPDTELVFSFQTIAQKMSKLLDTDLLAEQIIGQISQIVYDGGIRSALTDSAKANLTLAQQTYKNTVITATNDVITLGKNFAIASNLEKQALERVDIAKKGLETAHLNYKVGRINFNQLLQTQNNYNFSQTALIGIQQNLRNIYFNLVTASGLSTIYN
jgi:outer membrane protein TolC